MRPLALFIGLRYTRAKRRNHFVSFISGISILGITVGVWALITVLSIMNGFERELRGRILSVAAHVTISSSRGWLGDWEGLAKTALKEQGVRAAAPYILGQGLLTRGNAVTGVLVRGVLPANERTVSTL
ncbi:MAG: lipoprotein-releasing system transmembrane subunit LolC, partial [Acidiferrobacteraceae bacterium]|nr:lipoprotein-releasing system transmembrane subunit LolC [Acidiferrobacteraceae bacterium]